MDDDSNSNLLEKIRQYQNSIIKHSEKGNDERILYYIKKLYDMSVTVEHLKQTGIGRTMNSLRKYSGNVGMASKAIVAKWKCMVSDEELKDVKSSSSPPAEESASPPESPPPQPSPPVPASEKPKIRSDDKYSKRDESREKSSSRRHDSSDRSSKSKSEDRHSKSHHRKEEKRNSHKSSHREKEKSESNHKNRHESGKHRKDEKSRHEHKRKHEEERTSSKKLKYEEEISSDSEDSNRLLVQDNILDSPIQSDDNILPDSTTHHADSRENTQSPAPVEKTEKKHHKSDKNDKHRSRDKDRDKKEMNGSHSSKKSSHKDKESKHESPKKEKSTKTPSAKSSKTPEKNKKIQMIVDDNGIDSGSGASFAEALGMMGPTKNKSTFIKRKSGASPTPTASTSAVKPTRVTPTPSRPRTQSPLTQNANLLSPNLKLEPLDTSIVSQEVAQLPEITTNYKPLGLTFDPSIGLTRHLTAEEALSEAITTKTQRTKVYSGNKTNWGFVPSLFQICVRVLQDNIDALEYTGGVPYEILKPVLERATANQLLNSEYYNPYLIEETDELWELHCKRECKAMKRQEMETWREMYLRIRDERDAKLKALTVNIKQSIDKSLPVRQTKLAYVDSVVKPPRGIARKQAKYGTSSDIHRKPLITPSQRLNSIASASGGEKVSSPAPRSVSTSSSSTIKPKKAPLMQKTLALMKGRFGRR